jgi:hypothetical protein
MRIQVYSPADKELWDDFVRQSKNGTFLLLRDYMDYHQDRFEDSSLLVWDNKERLIALLPANREGQTFVSHGGLTFGGFITDRSMKVPTMLELFECTRTFLVNNAFTQFDYKTVPHIYHLLPAEEDLYALFLCNAHLVRRGVLTVVAHGQRPAFQERRARRVKRAQAHGITSRASEDWATYWDILTQVLVAVHGTQPVHTVQEIQMLHSRFPKNIKLFAAYRDSELLAGVVIYESALVAHTQYIAANQRARDTGALDHLFHFLLEDVYKDKAYFDFGTSDENNGLCLKQGLIEQKEGFGARAVMHDHYTIRLQEWSSGQLRRVLQ